MRKGEDVRVPSGCVLVAGDDIITASGAPCRVGVRGASWHLYIVDPPPLSFLAGLLWVTSSEMRRTIAGRPDGVVALAQPERSLSWS